MFFTSIERTVALSQKSFLAEGSLLDVNSKNAKVLSLIEAIKENNEKEFFRILTLKTDNFGKKFIDEFDAEHQGSPVYWAAAYGYTHFIPHLIKADVDANKPDKNGITPIFIAAQEGHASAIAILYAARADVNTPDNNGRTPVFIAAYNGHTEAIRALHAGGANVNTLTDDGFTPVFIAALQGHASAVTALQAAGADVNTPCYGETPVYVAAENGHLETIRSLHAAGANVDMPNSDGKTPVFIAAQEGDASAIAVLHIAGANMNTPNRKGVTPIFAAAQEGHAAAIAALLEAGADASTKVIASWCRSTTALNTVKQSKSPKHREVLQVLEAHFKQYPDGIKSVDLKTYCPCFSSKTIAISFSALGEEATLKRKDANATATL